MASTVEVRRVENKKMKKQFIMLPWTAKIYENDPAWVPPVIHDVKKFLNQWTTENAKIKLTIGDVNIQKLGTGFRTNVEIEVDSEKDYDFVTAIGYKTSRQENLTIVPIYMTRNGKYVHILDTQQKPTYIQIDPYFSVPRINIGNCEWKG